MVIYGKKLQLYPLIARRVWAVLDPEEEKVCSFLTWISILRTVAYGTFSSMCFSLFLGLKECSQTDRPDVVGVSFV